MNNKELAKKLSELVQLDIDAVEAYGQALKNIDVASVYNSIASFRDDHIHHIKNLSEIIITLGEQPPEHNKDFKGFLIEGFTAIRSVTGTVGALNAMEMNEELTNRTYKSALEELEMPEEVKEVVQKNYQDEQRHLQYIKNILASGQLG